jgi:dTDP-glucose 4,6-dehydratase
VTGGCGFIGSNFINIFYDKYPDINIINIDALYYCADENNIKQEIRENFRYNLVKGNICSEDLVSHILDYYKIDTVIHFAAQSHVQTSFTDALQYTKDNVMGTHTLLECCRKYGKIKKFIHVSTDEVYGESLLDVKESKKTEQSLLCPTNPYAASKAAAELIVQSYIKSFEMPIIITRGNNVYGPNQYPEKVIPRFIEQLKNGEKITIQGNGSCVRGFLHVNDTVDAFIKILEKGKMGEIYNIGCDEDMEISILDLAKYIYKLSNIKSHFQENVRYIEDRPFNDQRYYIENQKLKNLGWKITKKLDDGLKELIKK